MADPITFQPGYSYTGWEATNPTKPKPGPELDNDFADVGASTTSLVNAIKDVRRSDGALKNKIVTYDSLAPDVAALLGTGDDFDIIIANLADIIAVAEDITNVNIVAGNTADIDTVAANVADVNTVADNIVGIIDKLNNTENKTVYAVKTGNYTAVLADNNAVHRFTAVATVAIAAAATLGSNWHYTVIADVAPVTIDPNGAETISGLPTLVLPIGTSAEIISDGTNFFAKFKPHLWEPIGPGVYSGSGAASFALTDIGGYKRLRISGTISPSVAAALVLQTSSNNGSSYDSGATDYTNISHSYQGTADSTTATTTTSVPISAGATINPTSLEAAQIDMVMERFNDAAAMKLIGSIHAINASGIFGSEVKGQRNQATARNAFRIISGSGTLTYNLFVEGSRI